MRLGSAYHALTPPVFDGGLGGFHAWTVETIERTGRQVAVELRTIGGSLQHERRYGADQRGPGSAALAMSCQIMGHLAASGRMADVDGVLQVKMSGERGEVVGVVVHVVAVGCLAGAPVTAAITR